MTTARPHSGQPVKKTCAVVSLQAKPFLFVATKIHVRVYHLQQQRLVKKLLSSCKHICSLDVHPSVRARARPPRVAPRGAARGEARGRGGGEGERASEKREHAISHPTMQDKTPSRTPRDEAARLRSEPPPSFD